MDAASPSDPSTHRFGELVRQLGLATPAEIERALAEQDRRRVAGRPARLGQILVHAGVLTAERVRKVLVLQGKTLLVCPGCDASWNVADYEPGIDTPCPACGTGLDSPPATAAALPAAGTVRQRRADRPGERPAAEDPSAATVLAPAPGPSPAPPDAATLPAPAPAPAAARPTGAAPAPG
ncbi:MAG: hypothetical protein HZA54_10015, partial [Planctomycetes bacterium]|nr:hypothetical protein [Planctomycetota bacterium]